MDQQDQNQTSAEITDVSAATDAYLKQHRTYWYGGLAVIAGAVLIVIVLTAILHWKTQVYFIAVFLGAAAAGILKAKIYFNFQRIFMQEFAQKHGLNYIGDGTPPDADGSVFKASSYSNATNLILGSEQDIDVAICDLNYYVHRGRNTTPYWITLMQIDSKTLLPSIFLQNKNHRYYSGVSDWYESNIASVNLEPAYAQNFYLYAPKEMQLEALQIFNQDFLNKMLSQWSKFSIECVNNHIYVYSDGTVGSLAELESMYALAQDLIQNIPRFKAMTPDVKAVEDAYGAATG